jgi:hypothetical protein
MTEFIKILLGSEDIVIRDNEDSFLNLELSRIAKEVKPDSVDNDFDLENQYVKERNESLKFCIYGILESKYSDCSNVDISVKTSDGDLLFSPKTTKSATGSRSFSIKTSPLSKGGFLSKNIYGKEKGAYSFLFEISRDQLNKKISSLKNRGKVPKTDRVILSIDDVSKRIFDVIEIPFIFYDESGDFIPYGTVTSEVNEDGSVIETNNDFPFFYDRHWIKTNIGASKVASVSFSSGSTTVLENVQGSRVSVGVELDFPSKLGREKATIVVDSDQTTRNPNSDFSFSPTVISWKAGERVKTFDVQLFDDLFVENPESVTFGMVSVENADINIRGNAQFVLNIADDDIPSFVNFRQSLVTVSESGSTLSLELTLDAPVLVPGQSIDVVIDSNATTAVLEKDFTLGVPNRPGVNGRTIFFKEGDTGFTFNINLINDFEYELNKKLTLRLENPTQNLRVGTQTPSVEITITDSMVTNLTRYVVPASQITGRGAFRVNRKTNDEQYEWSLANLNSAFVNNFKFTLEVFNLGVPVVFDGKIINGAGSQQADRLVFSKSFVSGITESVIVDLPANDSLDSNARAFRNSKYQFVFSDIQSDVNIATEGINVFNRNKYFDVTLPVEAFTSSGAGESMVYLVSEISKIKSRYNPATNLCEVGLNSTLSDIKINGIAFLPKTELPSSSLSTIQKTTVQSSFRRKPIQNHCDFNGIMLPLGFNPVSDIPVNKTLVELSFRNMFVQAASIPSDINSNLIVFDRNSQFPSQSLLKGFFNWAQASARMKSEIEMHITNAGGERVKISGKSTEPGETVVIRQEDLSSDFSGLKLLLEGNTSYDSTTNSFKEASYSISFKNINFYDRDEGFIKGPVELPVSSFKFPASDSSVPSPVYVLVSQYDSITLGSNGFGQNLCSGNVFDTTKNIKTKGMLLVNSKTSFNNAVFVPQNSDIVPTCPLSPFQHLIL